MMHNYLLIIYYFFLLNILFIGAINQIDQVLYHIDLEDIFCDSLTGIKIKWYFYGHPA